MTIEKGADWGTVVDEPTGGIHPPTDLCRDLGVETSTSAGILPSQSGRWLRLPIDSLAVSARLGDGTTLDRTVVTWLAAGRRLRGTYVVVSSTAFVVGRRLFSRAHPNDGRLDWMQIDAMMGLRQRFAFWRRTRTETHLPHPAVRTGAGGSFAIDFDRPVEVRFGDAEALYGVVALTVVIVPDATWTHIPAQ